MLTREAAQGADFVIACDIALNLVRVIASSEEPAVIARILGHLGVRVNRPIRPIRAVRRPAKRQQRNPIQRSKGKPVSHC